MSEDRPPLTGERVRELLKEGRKLRAEIEKRTERMQQMTFEQRFEKMR
jgi:hypothetical protein